jgi:hypothetical protein
MPPETASDTDVPRLESRIATVGERLGRSLVAVLETVPGAPHRPQMLASTLGVDKVLTSRLLKAARHRDPLAVVHLVPGSEPMRRVFRAALRQGAPAAVIDEAMAAVDAFDQLVQEEAGDRSALDAMISAWLPEARAQMEVRRKQSAYRAMSELKGGRADVSVGTVMLHPSSNGTQIDIVWIMGMIGVRRLRPDAAVKFTTRRFTDDAAPRKPVTLEGDPIDGLPSGVRLDRFCDATPASLDVHKVGDVTHYTLAGTGFGPHNDVDLVMAEVNLNEMPRYVPRRAGRKAHVFAEVSLPARLLLFDVFVHRDLYPGSHPELVIYDTVLEGVASVNDRTRDVDRIDLLETITPLGDGIARVRAAEIPHYHQLIRHAFERMGWDDGEFRGYRCRIEYPIYGSQVVMAFDPPPPPDGAA